jgi:aspartyl-tRNA(Asn)/glutamyl-tRNA(Gln) amidotransferase subunit A
MIGELLDQIEKKERSVTEIVSEYLDRIEKLDPALNAFITVDREGALKKAKELDKIYRTHKSDKIDTLFKEIPLFGIPIAHKDIFTTKSLETTAGSNILKGYIPVYDATVVSRLNDAGAIVLGKLN